MKDIKVINKAIAGIKTAGAKLDAAIQETAIDVLEHFMEHRDTGLVNRLYLAMPKGSRGLALAEWLRKFVAVKVNLNKETKEAQPFVYDATKLDAMMAPENLATAKATPWHGLKKERALDEEYDVAKGFRQMLRHIERSTKVEHFNRDALIVMAKAVGIPESDVPTQPGVKAKVPTKAPTAPVTTDVLATAEPAPQ